MIGHQPGIERGRRTVNNLLSSGNSIVSSARSASGNMTIVANGGTEGSAAVSGFPATGGTYLGSTLTTYYLNGYIRRLAAFSSQLPSSQRVALSLQ